MKPIRIGSASRIEIGYDGENGARAVVFDATKWMDEMPGCTAAITAQRADGQEYIAPDVTQDEAERTITWTLTSAETMEGEGRAQLLWMDGERIAKQAIFTTVCHESLKSDATQIGVPEPVWAQKSLAAAQEARKSAEAAKVSEIGAQNALEETKGVRDAAKQEIDTKKEGALAGIENAKAEAIVSIEAGKDELAPPVIPEATGTSIVATDSADRPLRGLTVYGKTTQDGTPSEDAPVDPMGTGTASPLRIVTAGRNLAALTPRTENNNGITSGYDAQTGVVTVTGTATGVAFVSYWLREPIPAGVSMVIGLGNGSSDNNIAIRAQSASENANTTIATISSTNTVVKVTLTHAFEFLSIRVSAGATVNMKLQIGVTVGSDSAGYTWTHPDDPTSVQIIIPVSHFAVGGLLHGVPAISGGNVTDGRQWIADTVEYDAQAGTAQLVQRVGSVTYFGGADENWVKGGSGSYFEIRRADKSSASHGLCTHYPGLAINAGEYKVGFSAATDKEYIRFRPTGYADMTVDQWRARLDASPVTVLYALAEPVTTPITGDELAALTALRSRYPATTIYNDAGAQMAVRYIADTKKYVDDADAEIAKAVIGVDERVDAAMENIADAGKRADAAQTKADENERNIGQLKGDFSTLITDGTIVSDVIKDAIWSFGWIQGASFTANTPTKVSCDFYKVQPGREYHFVSTDSNIVCRISEYADKTLDSYTKLIVSPWSTDVKFVPEHDYIRICLATLNDTNTTVEYVTSVTACTKNIDVLDRWNVRNVDAKINELSDDLYKLCENGKVVLDIINDAKWEFGWVQGSNYTSDTPTKVSCDFYKAGVGKTFELKTTDANIVFKVSEYSDKIMSSHTKMAVNSWSNDSIFTTESEYIRITLATKNDTATTIDYVTSVATCTYVKRDFPILEKLEKRIDDITPQVYEHAYTGGKISLKNRYNRTKIGKINTSMFVNTVSSWLSKTPQAMAESNGNLFITYTGGGVGVVKADDLSYVGDFVLPLDAQTLADFHSSNVSFGTSVYGDTNYPLMYVCETTGQRRCFVFAVSETSATLVQTITFDGEFGNASGNNYRDFLVDRDFGVMYIVGYYDYNKDGNKMIVKKTALQDTSIANVTIHDSDVLDSFENDAIKVIQGCVIHGGKLFVGNNNGQLPLGVSVFNLDTHALYANINLSDVMSEPEGVAVYNNKLYVMSIGSDMYTLEFED